MQNTSLQCQRLQFTCSPSDCKHSSYTHEGENLLTKFYLPQVNQILTIKAAGQQTLTWLIFGTVIQVILGGSDNLFWHLGMREREASSVVTDTLFVSRGKHILKEQSGGCTICQLNIACGERWQTEGWDGHCNTNLPDFPSLLNSFCLLQPLSTAWVGSDTRLYW